MTSASAAAASAAAAPAPAEKRTTPKDYTPDDCRQIADLIKTVAEPTRLAIVLNLAQGETYVGALCATLKMGQPAVSHHLGLLRASGVVTSRREGKQNHYSLTPKGRELSEISAD